jgi:predicted RNA methylase
MKGVTVMNLLEFYPTPPSLAAKMLDGIDFKCVNTVLEPSAGTGNICDEINKRLKRAHEPYSRDDDKYRGDIDCIEIDGDLRGVLKNNNYHVVHDDFLTYRSRKKYDLIAMNPPFSDGDKHLMKALEMQETYGGAVVCVLNAETIRNPFSNLRKVLVRRLKELGAEIEYLTEEFISAERRTNVEIALIKAVVPEKDSSLILDHLDKAKERHENDFIEPAAVAQGDFILAIIEKYNYEIDAGVNLIREYMKLQPYIMNGIGEETVYKRPIMKLEIEYSGKDGLTNSYIKQTRLKYWKALFYNKEFTRSLTQNLVKEMHSRVDELRNYEFSYHNIMEMKLELNRKTIRSIEDTIIKLFDDLSHKHSYYDETSANIWMFNGWKTNKAYKINKKVIIPLGTFDDIWKKFQYRYDAVSRLSDIEKCLAFLDGGASAGMDLSYELDAAETLQKSKDIQLKYFKVTFYKKGTCHITFTDERLLEKFNIFGCRRKGWLPPCYGRKRKADMSAEEKAAVDSFGGDYDEVLRDKKYYIVESGQFLLAAGVPGDDDENTGQSDVPGTVETPAADNGGEQPDVLEDTEEPNETDDICVEDEQINEFLLFVTCSDKYEQLSIA